MTIKTEHFQMLIQLLKHSSKNVSLYKILTS